MPSVACGFCLLLPGGWPTGRLHARGKRVPPATRGRPCGPGAALICSRRAATRTVLFLDNPAMTTTTTKPSRTTL